MARARKALPTIVASGAVALLIFAWFGHAFLNYDTFYALVWGGDLAHGRAPQYDVPVAPTPHPLAIAVGMPVSAIFGDHAEDVMLGLVILAIGFLVVGLYRLGGELFSRPVGLLAAAIFATRVPPLNFGIRGYVDLPAIAFIVWGAVLEARRPRRGWPVLALMGLAGLLRPEAWLYAGAYWVWLFPARDWPDRLRLLALAAAAPVIWGVSDLLVTGDALWSLHGTHDLAAQLGRKRGLGNVPPVMPRRLGEIMRLPELIASVIGIAAGLAWMRSRTVLPAAVAILNGIAFLVLAVADLPLLGRYLFLAGAMLSVLAAVAVFGWTAPLPDGRVRQRWRAGGWALLAVIVVFFVAQQVDRLDALRDDIANRDRVQADLHGLVHLPVARAALRRCGALFVPNHRPVPELSYWTGRRPKQIEDGQRVKPTAGGLFVAPATPAVAKLSILDPRDPTAPATKPGGYRELARNRSWVLFGDCRV